MSLLQSQGSKQSIYCYKHAVPAALQTSAVVGSINEMMLLNTAFTMKSVKDRTGRICHAWILILAQFLLASDFAHARVKLDSLGSFLTRHGYGGAQLVDSGTFYHLPIHSNGKPGNLVIDTGSPSTIIFRSSVKRLGLNENRTNVFVRGAFGQGNEHYGLALIGSFESGNCRLENVPVAIAPDLGGMNAYGRPNGLLGVAELTKFGAVVDLPHNMVYLRPHRPDYEVPSTMRTILEGGGWKAIQLTQIRNHLRVPGEANDKPCHFLVDTGAYLTALDRGFARAAKIPIRPTHATAHGIGRTGGSVGLGTFGSLWIGDYQIRNASAVIMEMDSRMLGRRTDAAAAGMLGRGTDGEVAGLLGVEYLARNSAIFDFVSGTLYLKPRLPR
jgi:predicted aspartyl protease